MGVNNMNREQNSPQILGNSSSVIASPIHISEKHRTRSTPRDPVILQERAKEFMLPNKRQKHIGFMARPIQEPSREYVRTVTIDNVLEMSQQETDTVDALKQSPLISRSKHLPQETGLPRNLTAMATMPDTVYSNGNSSEIHLIRENISKVRPESRGRPGPLVLGTMEPLVVKDKRSCSLPKNEYRVRRDVNPNKRRPSELLPLEELEKGTEANDVQRAPIQANEPSLNTTYIGSSEVMNRIEKSSPPKVEVRGGFKRKKYYQNPKSISPEKQIDNFGQNSSVVITQVTKEEESKHDADVIRLSTNQQEVSDQNAFNGITEEKEREGETIPEAKGAEERVNEINGAHLSAVGEIRESSANSHPDAKVQDQKQCDGKADGSPYLIISLI